MDQILLGGIDYLAQYDVVFFHFSVSDDWSMDSNLTITFGENSDYLGRTLRLVENRKSKILRKSRPISQNSHFHPANDFGYGFSPRRF